MTKPDGGPAFPSPSQRKPSGELLEPGYVGMTLLDYFAAQALSNTVLMRAYHNRPDCVAQYAYRYADAMLAEREKSSD